MAEPKPYEYTENEPTRETLFDFVDSISRLLLHCETGYRGEPDHEYIKANHELLEQLIRDARKLTEVTGEKRPMLDCLD